MTSHASRRPIVAEFSGSALRQNADRARALTAPSGKVFAVIKADAYGHGLLEVAARLSPAVDGFAILELSAAQALRQHGYDGPILMLEGFFKADELQVFSQWQLDTVIHCTDQIQTLTLTQLSQPLNVFLKLNTGMNRLGFTPGGGCCSL